MKRYADVISGCVLSLIGIIMLIETRNIRALMLMEFGPKIMPRIYSVGLIGLGAAIAIIGAVRARQHPSASQSSHMGPIDGKKVALTMGLIAFYVVALRPLGFLVTSIIYLFFQILVLGGAANKWRLLPYALISLVVVFGVYALFFGVFRVFLPPGRIW